MSRSILPSCMRHEEPRGRLVVAPRRRGVPTTFPIDHSEAEAVSLFELARDAGDSVR